jgi:hypothetical protein
MKADDKPVRAPGVGDIVRLWVDDPVLGSGWRYLVVSQLGTKWAHLFSAPLLATYRMPIADFQRQARIETGATAKRTKRIIRERVREAKAYSAQYSQIAADAALAALN